MPGLADLPPEDQPHTIDVGDIRGIPIIEDDDPRFVEERAAWSRARARAQAMHSPDELLEGLRDLDWMVRHEVIDRLAARARDDERTIPALLNASRDQSWEVRDCALWALFDFPGDEPREAIAAALSDEHAEVRKSAALLTQQRDLREP